MKVAIIGGGAAGFFAALSVAQHHPHSHISVFEKSNKLLSKVLVSGGGRCNVTNAEFKPALFAKNYPRGHKFLKKAFTQFSAIDTVNWFKNRNITLIAEADGRMFPESNSSTTIVNCFINEAKKLGVEIHVKFGVQSINTIGKKLQIQFDNNTSNVYDKVIVATGGFNKQTAYNWLKQVGHSIEPPLPSLFTFNMPGELIKSLQGVSVANTEVTLQGEKLSTQGALLITHWGMSGPAILKLSAFGAKILAQKNYQFFIQVNWLGGIKEHELRKKLIDDEIVNQNHFIGNNNPFYLPKRLWEFILQKTEVNAKVSWKQLGNKQLNKLVNALTNDVYRVEGKTTFKEEFVTCGGVSLNEVSLKTMQSIKIPNLYFAGEVLDIDGITGGFNFQAAWTTGYIAGKLLP